MWMPRWIKRTFFGARPTSRTTLRFITKGGMRALKTRTTTHPPVIIFGIFDGDEILFNCLVKPGTKPELAGELTRHLTEAAQNVIEGSDAP